MQRVGLILVLAILVLVQPAAAQPKWAQGQVYSGIIDLGGVQVPLPAGDWQVTGVGTRMLGSFTDKSEVFGWRHDIGLAQIIDGRIRATSLLSYNERTSSAGWIMPESQECKRKEIHHARVIRDRQLDKSCQFVLHLTFIHGRNSPEHWQRTVAFFRDGKIEIPSTVMLSAFSVSDRLNFIYLSFSFNPEYKGFPKSRETNWATNDWHPMNTMGNEARNAFVQSIIDWTENSRPMVEAGLAGKLKKGAGLEWPAAMQ